MESNEENESKHCREPHTSMDALHRPLPKYHPQRVQEERKYLDRENHGKMRIQKLLEAGNISFDVHGAKDMEKGMKGKPDPFVVLLKGDQNELCLIPGENGKLELGGNLICIQKEVSKEMIIELKPKTGATVKDFSSPVEDTEITNELETLSSTTITVTSGDDEALDKQKLPLDFSRNKIVAIIGKVDGAKGNT